LYKLVRYFHQFFLLFNKVNTLFITSTR